MNSKPAAPSFAATRLCIAVAIVLLAGGLADPSGIFTWIGFTGGPVAALWWWAPYVVYLPTSLVIVFVGARWCDGVAGAAARSRRQAMTGFWAISILAIGVGELAGSACALLPMVWRGQWVIPWSATANFLLWSSGYAALKMALVGWLPATIAVIGPRAPATLTPGARRAGTGALGVLVAGLVALAVAGLGPWLARHWWQGSPLGYVYGEDPALLAPTPASGAGHATLALAIFAALLCALAIRRLRGTPAGAGRPAFAAGAIAGLLAVAALLLVQGVLLVAQAGARAPDHDAWNLPALFVRAVDASSFALVVAAISGVVAVAAGLLQEAADRRADGRRDRLLAVSGGVALALALGIELAGALAWQQASQVPPHLDASPSSARDGDGWSPLAVRTDAHGPQLVDATGARVTLRGVNINQLGAYLPRDRALATVQPLTEQDFADIASLGMNVVRLTLSWSLLEPERGHVSPAYLARIRQALAWARAHRVRVLLDMHQDAWSTHVGAPKGTRCRAGTEPMVGWDGAPGWATMTDGTPPCMVTGRDLAPNVSRAFQSFYADRDDIQASLVHDWQVLAGEFGDDATVAGYDLLNEPNFGESPPLSSTLQLANYDARCIEAIRAGEARRAGGFAHPIVIEPSIIWSGFGIDNLPPRAFTQDTQIVFSPHLYNESITADQDFGLTLVSVERGYALARAAAAQLKAPLWIGEWGYFRSSPLDQPLMQRSAHAEDAADMGSTFWVWKQGCSDPHVWPGQVAGNLRQLGCPAMHDIGTAADMAGVLSRPYLRVSADRGARLRATGAVLSMSGRFERAGVEGRCALQLWVPGGIAPQVDEAIGVSAPEIKRQAPGSAALGASGGWIVDACLSGGPYRLVLRQASSGR